MRNGGLTKAAMREVIQTRIEEFDAEIFELEHRRQLLAEMLRELRDDEEVAKESRPRPGQPA